MKTRHPRKSFVSPKRKFMRTFLRILRIIQSREQYRKLLIPMGFFTVELMVALVLNWQLFGEHYEFSNAPGRQQASIHNPLIVIKSLHSDRLTLPYGQELSQEMPIVHFYSEKYMLKALCFLTSLMFAYIGIFIAMLWINRFFKNNNLNIRWWQWPTACMGAHVFLLLLANSNLVSHIF